MVFVWQVLKLLVFRVFALEFFIKALHREKLWNLLCLYIKGSHFTWQSHHKIWIQTSLFSKFVLQRRYFGIISILFDHAFLGDQYNWSLFL